MFGTSGPTPRARARLGLGRSPALPSPSLPFPVPEQPLGGGQPHPYSRRPSRVAVQLSLGGIYKDFQYLYEWHSSVTALVQLNIWLYQGALRVHFG